MAVADAPPLVAVGVTAAVTAGLGEVVVAGVLQANVRRLAAVKISAVTFISVPRARIELATHGSSDHCSTN